MASDLKEKETSGGNLYTSKRDFLPWLAGRFFL